MWCSLLSARVQITITDNTDTDTVINNDAEVEGLDTPATANKKRDYDAIRRENEEFQTPALKKARFEPTGEDNINDWGMPSELASYINKGVEIFVPEKTLKENILVENPVPNNVSSPKSLDVFMKELLEQQGKNIPLP